VDILMQFSVRDVGAFTLAIFAIVAFDTLPAAAQPSFDCNKATLPAERLVCASQTLSGLDEMLARSYTVAVGELGIAGTCLRTDQSRWLRVVRNACRDESCLTNAYRLRLAELNPFQPGATFVKDVPTGPELVAAVPPAEVGVADMPNNPDPKPMAAEGSLSEEGGGYVLTVANGATFVAQNFYFNEVTIKRFNDVLVAANARTRFRLSGFRAAINGNVFEPRRCIMVHRLPG
jgi:uncharacterized protein